MGNCKLKVIILIVVVGNLDLTSAKLGRVYEGNPFFNGELQPGIHLPQGPVNDPIDTAGADLHHGHKPNLILPTKKPVTIGPIHDDLYKYCLQPRGQFQGPYCNSFVNCWDGNAVKQFCGASLVYNPKGYCDYAWNVNCNGKPIKEIAPTNTGSNGWPSDGSYVPPPSPSPTLPPVTFPTGPTLRPPQTPPPYRPGGIFTIEPPGFGQHDPVHKPSHDHVAPTTTTTTTTWRPTIATQPPAYNELRKYCLHPRGQFAGPDCHKFINCWDDVVIEQDCPEDLHFNPNKHYCDFPYNYPCRHLKDNLDFSSNLDQVPEDNKLDS